MPTNTFATISNKIVYLVAQKHSFLNYMVLCLIFCFEKRNRKETKKETFSIVRTNILYHTDTDSSEINTDLQKVRFVQKINYSLLEDIYNETNNYCTLNFKKKVKT